MADAPAAASASASEPFSIRGFALRMRSVDAARRHPFGGGCSDGEPPPPLPPMEPPPRSRWWAHELAAVRARLSVGALGGDAAAGRCVLRKGTKRKEGSRSVAAAERAKKRRRVLQFRSLLKNKEKTCKPLPSRLCRHMLHMGLLRKLKGSNHSRRELALRKRMEERMGPSSDMPSSLSRRKGADSSVNEQSIKISGPIKYPVNTCCEVVRHAAGAKDDIFEDLPLLESSKVIFQAGGDELPTVIEESFITDQSDPDAEPETLSLKLMNAYDIAAQSSPPLDDLVKIEGMPDKEPICISCNDTIKSCASSSGIDCLPNHRSINMAKTHGGTHLKYSCGPSLNSYYGMRSKCSSDDTDTNFSQGINKHSTSSATALPVMRTRTEATNCEDALGIVKKSTGILGPPVATNNLVLYQGNVLPYAVSQGVIDSRNTKNHLSSQGSELPLVVSQGVIDASAAKNHCSSQGSVLSPVVSHALYANEMTSCRSMPASTSFATTPPAARTRTRPTNYEDAPVIFKNSTDVSGPLATFKNHFLYQGSVWPSAQCEEVVNKGITNNNLSSKGIVLPSATSQRVGNAKTHANEMTSGRSMPAKECIPTSISSGSFISNVCYESRKPLDECATLSTEKQGNWYSKDSPANIGLAFMKLPGLERMEISSGNVKTGDNKLMNEESLTTLRCHKEQLVSSTTNITQDQKNTGAIHSHSGKTVLNGYMCQDIPHPQHPTMRLMGKTVSVCKRSKDHSASNMGKVCSRNIITEAIPLTAIPCQLPQKRSFPCQDFVIQSTHLNDSSDFVPRFPSNSVSAQNATFNGVRNQRQQHMNSVSSTIKDCTWNFGTQSVHQGERNMVSMVSANSQTRHVELHQLPHMASIPRNQQSQFGTPASCRTEDNHNLVVPTRTEFSPIPQRLLKSRKKEKYQESTLLCYDDPSSAPISQPYQMSGTKLPSASIISFIDYGSNNSATRYPSFGPCPSLTTSLANISVSANGRSCKGTPTNTDGKMDAVSANQISNRSACADNVSQQPAKKQLVTDRHDFISTGPNMTNHSLGWSLDDAVDPQILDFRNKVAGDAAQTWRYENNNSRVSSGSIQTIETRWRSGLVAEAKTTLKPGQNVNDEHKLLYPATFSVDSGVNSVVL